MYKEKIINGLYGLAVADAVGNPFEFLPAPDKNSVVEYANTVDILTVSDDTQMTLFGFDAMKYLPSYPFKLEDSVKHAFQDSYIEWYNTQQFNTKSYEGVREGILQFDSLFSVQSPGNTCLSALAWLKLNKPVKNDSCGCGSVMRLLPLTMFFDELPLHTVVELGKITGNITHKHKANDSAIDQYLTTTYAIMNGLPFHAPAAMSISELGEGWIAQECVDMGIYAYSNASTFEELLQISICHAGDSDSVAAVAGSLWGLSGKEVPIKYINKLDALDAINYTIDGIRNG